MTIRINASGLQGSVPAGATIKALNMTEAVSGRQHITEVKEVGTAASSGDVFVAMREMSARIGELAPGDRVRVVIDRPDTDVDEIVTVTVEGTDTKKGKINLERIDVVATANGALSLTANTARPVGEPGAKVQLTNVATNEKVEFEITADGGLPTPLTIRGQAGQSLRVAVSDGTNNVDFAEAEPRSLLTGGGGGNDQVFDLADPAPQADDLGPGGAIRFTKTRYTGPLFVDGVSEKDYRQGAIGNCFEPSGNSAVAAVAPNAVSKMAREETVTLNGQEFSKYVFGFYNMPRWGVGTGRLENIEVDGDLWTRSFGGPVYGSVPRGQSNQATTMEMHFALREKARAIKLSRAAGETGAGSYTESGKGGISGQVMAELLGKPYQYQSVSDSNKDRIFRTLLEGKSKPDGAKWAITAGTHGHSMDHLYPGTGVYANHSYAVLDAFEKADAQGVVKRYVTLRNPWAESEPAGNGPNDGIFTLELTEFAKLYQSINYIDPVGSPVVSREVDPLRPLNSHMAGALGDMTFAQEAMNALLTQDIATLDPAVVQQWLEQNFTPLEWMSYETAVQARIDLERFAERISNAKAERFQAAFDLARAKLDEVIAREAAHLKTNQ